MRIGFDGSCLANRRGFGRFSRETLRALTDADTPHEWVVFLDRTSRDLVSIPRNCDLVTVGVSQAPVQAASSRGRRRVVDMLAMGRAASRKRLDLMFFPSTYSFFPVWNVGKVVVTMHDTLALSRPELVFPAWQGRVAWALKEHAAARWADRVLTVSESARRDLLEWFRWRDDRVRVVPEGPDEIFRPLQGDTASEEVLSRYGVDPRDRYLLYVGGLSPHKNLPRLIEAYARSGLQAERVALVLVGDIGDVFHTHVPELREAVARLGLASSVIFTGFVPDADLVSFYNRAEVLVQPSLMEGFGLPPIESMACGTPVVSSHAGSLPEVIGDAGVYFDPLDVPEMAATIRRVVDDPGLRLQLSTRALQRASQYTWEASARAILDSFDGLFEGASTWRRDHPVASWRRSA